jgi:hypothetical protein
MARLPAGNTMGGLERQVWSLPPPVGDIELVITNENLAQRTELTFRARGFDSEDDARAAGELLGDWLRLAGALGGYGFELGNDVQLSGLGPAAKPWHDQELNARRAFAVPDVFGLAVYEYQEPSQPLRFAMRGNATLQRSGETVRAFIAEAASTRRLGDGLALACELVCLADRETSDRARLLTLATAMEVLAIREERAGRGRSLVEEFIVKVKDTVASDHDPALPSLLGALKDLRKASISASVKQLARIARPADHEAVADIAEQTYKCRSQLIHAGRSRLDVARLKDEALPLVRDMIRRAREAPDGAQTLAAFPKGGPSAGSSDELDDGANARPV